MSPMQRSLAYYRDREWEPWIVERRLSYGHTTVDFFGVGDLVALKSGERPHLVQTTSGDNYAARRTKILASEHLPLLLEHFAIILHGWRKLRVKRGGKAVRWQVRIAEFSLLDVMEADMAEQEAVAREIEANG